MQNFYNKRYRLIALDIDGTLLDSHSRLSGRTKKALLAARDAGVLVCVSTGRPLRGVRWLAELLETDLPFITYNGAEVVMSQSEQVLYQSLLPPELSLEALHEGCKRDAGVFAWVEGELYSAADNPKNAIYRRIAGFDPLPAGEPEKLLQGGSHKILWCDEPAVIARWQEEMGQQFHERLHCHTSSPALLEFVSQDASKARAMDAVAARYGIRREETVAMGDGYNDVSMLRHAGLGVAMANAPDAVKAAADRVTLSNDEEGVAEFIERYIL